MPNLAQIDSSAEVQSRVVLHIDSRYHDKYRRAKHLAIFPAIEDAIRARGGTVVIAPMTPRDLPPEMRWGDGDLHIVQGGMARGVGYLNTGIAYLTGYWHMDAQGVLADSTALFRGFDPSKVDMAAARAFQRQLIERFVTARKSRYKQSLETQEMPQGCIAVFLQDPAPGTRGHQYMGQRAMLRAVIAGAGGRAVVVKPHPLRMGHGNNLIADIRAEGLDFIGASPNVHDLLHACAVTVSINSAASVEGFLHGKPAIQFGRSDFADQVEVVQKAGQFETALQSALSTPRDYTPWLYWYFNEFCLVLDAEDFEARLMETFADAGFDPQRLRLRGQ